MSSTFTPSTDVDQIKEKEWPAYLGMLDWDSTSIVFTKRTLIEFLKYTGTTVDTNFSNISKLPRYANFGKFSEPTEAAPSAALAQESAVQSSSLAAENGGFKPSRRVRDPPGGPISNIFAANDDDDDALSQAPSRFHVQPQEPAPVVAQVVDEEESGIPFTSSVKPSRRVRETPGGKDSLSNLWGGDDHAAEFKPTRRVREGPGGQDNINGLF